MFAFMMILSTRFIVKNVIQDQFIDSTIKTVIKNVFVEDKDLTKDDIAKIEEFADNKEVKKVLSVIFDEYFESLSSNEYKVKEENIDKIIEILIDNEDLIFELSDNKITEKDIRSQEVRNDIKEAFKTLFDENKEDINSSVKITINVYKTFVSIKFLILIISLIVISCLFIALIQQSYFRWLKPFGINLIITGLLITVLFVGLTVAIDSLTTKSDFKLQFDINGILVIGIIEVLIGILSIVVTHIFKKKKMSNQT